MPKIEQGETMTKKIMKDKKGNAMITVICILLVFGGLMATMIVSSYQSLNANQKIALQQQVQISLLDFHRVFSPLLTDPETSSLKTYIQDGFKGENGVEKWLPYSETDPTSKREIISDYPEDKKNYGSILITMYWNPAQGETTYTSGAILTVHEDIVLYGETDSLVTHYELNIKDDGTFMWLEVE